MSTSVLLFMQFRVIKTIIFLKDKLNVVGWRCIKAVWRWFYTLRCRLTFHQLTSGTGICVWVHYMRNRQRKKVRCLHTYDQGMIFCIHIRRISVLHNYMMVVLVVPIKYVFLKYSISYWFIIYFFFFAKFSLSFFQKDFWHS